MKKIILLALITGLTAGFAHAHGNGWGGNQNRGPGKMGGGYGGYMTGPGRMGGGYQGNMMGPGMGAPDMMGDRYGDCPCSQWFGQDYQRNDQYQKFMEETRNLRRKLNEKQFEYKELRRNPNSKTEQISSLEKEIIELQRQLQDKAQDYR